MADDDYDEDEERPVAPPRPPGEGVRIIGAQEAAKREAELSGRLPEDAPRFGDVPPQPSGPRPAVRFPLPEDQEAKPIVAGTTEMPHWTEPPTGEVPRILATDEETSEEDDLEAWAALRRQPRWREGSDWEEADFDDASVLAGDEDEEKLGALDERSRPGVFSFDDDFDELEAEDEEELPPPVRTARPATRQIRTRPETADPYGTSKTSERDLPVAIAAGVGIGIVGLVCFKLGPGWVAALATIIVLLAAIEAFDVFHRAGHRPATLLGLVGTVALMVGAYEKGERALPLILALTVVFSMFWYLIGVVKARPTMNLGVTMLGVMWVGFLGSFASLMLRYPHREGIAFLLAGVIAVVANDVGALFAGRQFGRTPLAPEISPHKTVEGFLGGFALTLIACLLFVMRIHPWGFGSAVILSVVVSLVGPAGDLCESMIKRDLGIKDMGSIIPGHGGILDRFDALLFVLPAVYYLVEVLNLPGK